MGIVVTWEAVERARWVVQAAGVLRQQAPAIARSCAEAEQDSMVVAVVEQDTSFGGTWAIPRAELFQRVSQMEDGEGKWVLSFEPMTPVDVIEARCADVARLAGKRGETILRRLNLNR
jgi:hypothetical protein